MKLLAQLAVGALIVTFACLALGVVGGYAGEVCKGRVGMASYYGIESCVKPPPNCRTANGERYTGKSFTAASRTLPFNTRVRVTYRGKSVVVRITDRGPAAFTGRMIDLSKAAARAIGMIRVGVGRVCVERL